MSSTEITTSDLSAFGYIERLEMIKILQAWNHKGIPDDFELDDVNFMMNKHSGHVFLTNSDYQVVMCRGGELEMFHTCHNCGHEGFQEDCQVTDFGCNECDPEGNDDESKV